MDKSSLCVSISERENTQAVSSSSSLGGHDTMDKVSTGLLGELKINDGNETHTVQRIPLEIDYIEEDEEEEDEDENYLSEEALLAQMGYAKSETKRDYEEGEDAEEDLSEDSLLAQMGYLKNEPPKHEPITTPMSNINLVSAFKGSREKEGNPPKECRVSWAPDVHDPPCTSDEHFAPTKTERHRSELKAKGVAGKNRQKCGGKGVGPIEGGRGGGKEKKGLGSKGSVGGAKAAGKIKDKKKADKKTKKRGGTTSKYSDHDED